MRKSITGFIFGLIGSVFCLWWGFVFGIIGDIGNSIVNSANGSSGWNGTVSVMMILGWLAFIGAIVGIIGAANCFKAARKGGIILSVATAMCGGLQIYLFVNVMKSGAPAVSMLILFLLPTIFHIVADVCAFTAKEVAVEYNNYNQGNRYAQPNYQPQPNQYAQPQPTYGPQPQEKSLEQELTELKGMVDKGLLTEEEYNAAKANAIAKHTK